MSNHPRCRSATRTTSVTPLALEFFIILQGLEVTCISSPSRSLSPPAVRRQPAGRNLTPHPSTSLLNLLKPRQLSLCEAMPKKVSSLRFDSIESSSSLNFANASFYFRNESSQRSSQKQPRPTDCRRITPISNEYVASRLPQTSSERHETDSACLLSASRFLAYPLC